MKAVKPVVEVRYPRSKGKSRFDEVAQDGDGARWLRETKRAYLQGIGQVKVDVHRRVQGRVKTIQIKRQGRRWRWCCPSMTCRQTRCRPPAAVVGIASFATISSGEHIANPCLGRAAEGKLVAAQQRWQRAKRGPKNRGRRRVTVAARNRNIANQRMDFHHKQARRLGESYDVLAWRISQSRTWRAKPVPDPDHRGSSWPTVPGRSPG